MTALPDNSVATDGDAGGVKKTDNKPALGFAEKLDTPAFKPKKTMNMSLLGTGSSAGNTDGGVTDTSTDLKGIMKNLAIADYGIYKITSPLWQKKDAPTPPSVNLAKSTDTKALKAKNSVRGLGKMDAPVGGHTDASVHNLKIAGFGMMICEHCEKETQRKTHNQRFCSDVCRMAFHEFRFKKGG